MHLPRTSIGALLALTAMSLSTAGAASDVVEVTRPASYQELTPEEMAVLNEVSIASASHLEGKVAGGDCQTVCRDVKDSYGEWKRVCDTSCAESPSYSGPSTSKHPHLAACALGAAGGAVLGLLGGWTGSAIGAGVGCAVFGGLNFLFSE